MAGLITVFLHLGSILRLRCHLRSVFVHVITLALEPVAHGSPIAGRPLLLEKFLTGASQ